MVRLNVDIIIVVTTPAALAVMNATKMYGPDFVALRPSARDSSGHRPD
jgi:hypothetical protein